MYHSNFWPLEWTVPGKPNDVCYAKLICLKSKNVSRHVSMWNARVMKILAVVLRTDIKGITNGSCCEVLNRKSVFLQSTVAFVKGVC